MKTLKRSLSILSIIVGVCLIFFITVLLINSSTYFAIKDNSTVYRSDIEALSQKNYFGKFISTDINLETGNSGLAKINFKFFDLFKFKSKNVKVIDDKEVYLGGNVVAMEMRPDGLLVTKVQKVETEKGMQSAFESAITAGDLIVAIDNEKITEIGELQMKVQSGEQFIISVMRLGKKINIVAKPKQEKSTLLNRLGISVQDDLGGVGTLTFVNTDDGRFGALGHSMGHNVNNVIDGKIVKANIIGIEKGSNGRAGEIKAYESYGSDNELGIINKNTAKGVFGVIKNKIYIESFAKIKTGGRYSVKPGNAEIIAELDNEGPKHYSIKIIKANKQSANDVKGMIIKVTDKRLLNKAGGIIQGMSGSPIVQDGKLIGAVTHVFLNDSSKGYGIYFDSMANELN